MKNFSYNAQNQSVFEGYRVIALKNVDMERLVNAANMREPEISATSETVVEPQNTVEQVQEQNVVNTPNVQSESVPSQTFTNEQTPVYNEPVTPVSPIMPENTSINSADINIPEPVQSQPTVEHQPVESTPVVENGNIFDAPVMRDEVKPEVASAPVEQSPVTSEVSMQSAPAQGLLDLDEFMIKSQEIYDKAKTEMEEVLLKSQREQMNLVMQMIENLNQLKADNAAYSTAIDQAMNDESFKKVA